MTARIILQTILKPPTTTCLNGDIVQLAKQGLWTDEWENPLSCHLVLSQKPKEYFEKNYGGFILFFHLEFKINYIFILYIIGIKIPMRLTYSSQWKTSCLYSDSIV